MAGTVKEKAFRSAGLDRSRRLCAAIVLGLLVLATLHAVVPHFATQRHCFVCQALEAPGLAQAPLRLAPPRASSIHDASDPAGGLPSSGARLLKPLRAPPPSAVA